VILSACQYLGVALCRGARVVQDAAIARGLSVAHDSQG
jgi:hypothetical protein